MLSILDLYLYRNALSALPGLPLQSSSGMHMTGSQPDWLSHLRREGLAGSGDQPQKAGPKTKAINQLYMPQIGKVTKCLKQISFVSPSRLLVRCLARRSKMHPSFYL